VCGAVLMILSAIQQPETRHKSKSV
jgi:hypothetical protein